MRESHAEVIDLFSFLCLPGLWRHTILRIPGETPFSVYVTNSCCQRCQYSILLVDIILHSRSLHTFLAMPIRFKIVIFFRGLCTKSMGSTAFTHQPTEPVIIFRFIHHTYHIIWILILQYFLKHWNPYNGISFSGLKFMIQYFVVNSLTPLPCCFYWRQVYRSLPYAYHHTHTLGMMSCLQLCPVPVSSC